MVGGEPWGCPPEWSVRGTAHLSAGEPTAGCGSCIGSGQWFPRRFVAAGDPSARPPEFGGTQTG